MGTRSKPNEIMSNSSRSGSGELKTAGMVAARRRERLSKATEKRMKIRSIAKAKIDFGTCKYHASEVYAHKSGSSQIDVAAIPGRLESSEDCENDYSFKSIKQFRKGRDGPNGKDLGGFTVLPVDDNLSKNSSRLFGVDSSAKSSIGACTGLFVKYEQAELNELCTNAPFIEKVYLSSKCCKPRPTQELPSSDANSRGEEERVTFAMEFIEAVERSKEEIATMMDQYTKKSTDNSLRLDGSLGTYLSAKTSGMTSKCPDPVPDTCIMAPRAVVPEKVEMQEWEAFSLPEAGASSVFSPRQLSTDETKREDPVGQSSRDAHSNATNEKWDQLIAHLEKERLEGIAKTNRNDLYQLDNGWKQAKATTDLLQWRLDQEVSKEFESGETNVGNFVVELRCLLSRAGDGLEQLSGQVKDTLACTATVPDELIRCFDSQARTKERADPLIAETKIRLDRSRLSVPENKSNVTERAGTNELYKPGDS